MNVSTINPQIIITKQVNIWDEKSIDLCRDCQGAFLKWLNKPSVISVLEDLQEDIKYKALPQEYIDDVTVYVQARKECVEVIQRKIDSMTKKSEDKE